jgi:serine/threonine protein kinase
VAIKEFFMKDFCGRDERTKMVSAPTTGSNRLVDQYRKKFTKEARNLAKLNHPNIINVIDVFEENGTVYYAMPYLSGGSLDDYVRRHGALDESEAMKYVKQIARALKYMHEEHHICHYDVKPANILLDDKGNAVLIDFGISKNYDASGHETSTTPIGLSEGYAPIEQYQQSVEEFSPVSDVYALGATLYFLLHGKRPVNAPSRAGGTSLLMKKDLSPDTKNLISSTMKISKTERSQTMDVFFKEREVVESSYHHEGIDVGKIVFLVIIASIIIGGAVYYTGGFDDIIPQKNSVVDLVDTTSVDSSSLQIDYPLEEETPIDDNENIEERRNDINLQLEETKSAYIHIIDEYEVKGRENDYWGLYYFLYDITGDGIPELWIQANNEDDPHNLDGLLLVYSYVDGHISRLFKGDSGHPYHHSFYKGKDYILMDFSHMDSQSWTKFIYVNGYIYEREVSSGKRVKNYKTPSEQGVEIYEITDKSPIKRISL